MPHDTSAIADVSASEPTVSIEGTKTILLVGVGGQGTILAGNVLAMTAADAGRNVKYFGADAPEYHTGDRVRVTDGIYKGAEGYIKRIKKDRKLIVSVTGVAVVAVSYIHPDFLEKVD